MKKIYFLFFVFLSLPFSAYAASVQLVPAPTQLGAGDTFGVSVLVDSVTPVNTFSGELHYSNNLQLVAVSDGNSIVSLWVDRPHESAGAVPFAGLVPGGYSGQEGLLFVATFKAIAAGDAELSLQNASFLRNDGSGNAEEVSAPQLRVSIDTVPHGSATTTPDTQPPEPFVIEGGRGGILDGKAYVAFSTTDKGSGIDHFETAERRVPFMPLSWEKSQSPYVLNDQYGTSDLFVKAVDVAGNVQIEEYARAHALRPYEWYAMVLVLLIACVFCYFYAKRK